MDTMTSPGVSIEAASDDDLARCLTLIPAPGGGDIEHLVARREGEIVGTAAIAWQEHFDLPGFLLDIHVVPWARRQRIGTALCAAAVALADGETSGLWSAAAHEAGTPAERFLLHCRFAPARRYFFFNAVLADYRLYVTRMADRVRAHRRAHGIAIVELRSAPLDQVAWLITSHFASSPFALLPSLRARAPSDRLSRVAMRDGRVAGVIIARALDASVVVVDAWAVRLRDRRGAISPLLLDAVLSASMAAGFTHFDFHCDDLTRDTLGTAAHGAVLVAQQDRFYRAV
jgi:GNAT superfamily N-acetyltransferase